MVYLCTKYSKKRLPSLVLKMNKQNETITVHDIAI